MPSPVSRTSRHWLTFTDEPSTKSIVPGSEASSQTTALERIESGFGGWLAVVAPVKDSTPSATTTRPFPV